MLFKIKECIKQSKEKDIRYLFFEESLSLIKQKPIFGYGTGSFSSVFKENSSYDFEKHKTPHNNYLYILFRIRNIWFYDFFINRSCFF